MLWGGQHDGGRPIGWETPNTEPKHSGSKTKKNVPPKKTTNIFVPRFTLYRE